MLEEITIKENEHIDILKQNDCSIIQRKDGFCFGIDAVLLANYAKQGIRNNCKLIDLCTGTGIVPILLSKNPRISTIEALEIQEDSFDMASRSVKLNKMEEKIKIIKGDVKEVSNHFPKASYDVVTCNPPYMVFQHGKVNPSDYKAIARHEILCNLDDVVTAAAYLLKTAGSFFMIHRAYRLSEIFVTLSKHGLEPKKMQLISPFVEEKPNLVLIQAVKGGKPEIIVEKNLIVRDSDGQYTQEINAIYENGK